MEEASWEPRHHLTPELLAEYLSPDVPPATAISEFASVLCGRINACLSSPHPQTFVVPMSRPMFRHLFPCTHPETPSSKYCVVHLPSLSTSHFPPFIFMRLNTHGQGTQVMSMSVRHRQMEQKTGYCSGPDGKIVPQKSLFIEELSVHVEKNSSGFVKNIFNKESCSMIFRYKISSSNFTLSVIL